MQRMSKDDISFLHFKIPVIKIIYNTKFWEFELKKGGRGDFSSKHLLNEVDKIS